MKDDGGGKGSNAAKTTMKMRGMDERNKKCPTVKSAAGLMSHNASPKKGKEEF